MRLDSMSMLQCDEQAKTGEYLVKLFPAFCSFCYLRDDDILVLLEYDGQLLLSRAWRPISWIGLRSAYGSSVTRLISSSASTASAGAEPMQSCVTHSLKVYHGHSYSSPSVSRHHSAQSSLYSKACLCAAVSLAGARSSFPSAGEFLRPRPVPAPPRPCSVLTPVVLHY